MGSVAIPSRDTICPRYFNLALKNSHFEGLSLRPALASFLKNSLQSGDVIVRVFGEDDDIIQIYYAPVEV